VLPGLEIYTHQFSFKLFLVAEIRSAEIRGLFWKCSYASNRELTTVEIFFTALFLYLLLVIETCNPETETGFLFLCFFFYYLTC